MDNASLNRRSFLRGLSLTSLGVMLRASRSRAQAAPGAAIALTLGSAGGAPVPPNFVGLSYENMQLEDPTFFSPKNKSLIEQFRRITPHGVLRLGGNTSEFGWWKERPDAPAPHRVDSPWKASGEPTAATVFAITPEAIDNLHGFLEATGWDCIYGLNLGYGTPETDVPEAVYVSNKLGLHLAYFQIGNEVDLFKGHLRDPQTWNVDSYLQQWSTIAHAVQTALPSAKFGLPDVAADVSWLPAIADRWGSLPATPHLVSLSHHYYWSGPPSNPKANIENLLQPDPKVLADAQMAKDAAMKIGPGVTWRMTEGNTVYRGGKYGVSDVFAAALWSADYLLTLMSQGYAGVNLHGGSGHAQAVSVGGVFHGEALMTDPNAPHPKPFYTPIANEGTLAGSGVNGKLNGTYLLEPVAYGMQFAAAFAGATMRPVTFNAGYQNATAYAGQRPDGTTLLALLNKDPQQPLTVACPPVARIVLSLTAPALDSREAHIERGSHLTGTQAALRAGKVTVPPHTAWLLQLS